MIGGSNGNLKVLTNQLLWYNIILESTDNMADLVESVLREAAEKQAKFKTTEVEKDIEVDIDEGNLLAVDTNPLILKELK